MDKKETIGIFGGSFNPVHIGHLMIASYVVQWGYVDKVWLTLSPRSPMKDDKALVSDLKRLAMLKIATKSVPEVETCDIELSMPRPSYTIDTLRLLRKRYPNKRFKLIIGSDNWRIFDKWKEPDEILDDFGVLVYPRPEYPIDVNQTVDGMEPVHAPTANLSSTFIRNAISRGKNMNIFLPPGVNEYIIENELYKK